ncbi:putative Target of rapamycin complex subunit LST8 [Blattamonas nauphoetae]|uniref:Target of rapamycin complex subunit LST8 n=1 Tax=Blattamonas nauphoetae TaxID=2049346 RepID=A0ABQ9XM30_9EUKA|nr:putative Target of rapamycin complex subunit LST8 [Blattamonas nauphoetae]
MVMLNDCTTLVTGSEDKKVMLWKLNLNPPQKPERLLSKQFESPINSIAKHPYDNLSVFLAFQNGEIIRWHTHTDIQTLVRSQGVPIRSLSTAPGRPHLCAAGHNGRCFVYSIHDLQLTRDWEAHTGYITKCELSRDGTRLATCSADFTAKVWDMESPGEMTLKWNNIMRHNRWIWDCTLTKDGKSLITVSSDRQVLQWFENLSRSRSLFERKHGATCVALAEIDYSK